MAFRARADWRLGGGGVAGVRKGHGRCHLLRAPDPFDPTAARGHGRLLHLGGLHLLLAVANMGVGAPPRRRIASPIASNASRGFCTLVAHRGGPWLLGPSASDTTWHRGPPRRERGLRREGPFRCVYSLVAFVFPSYTEDQVLLACSRLSVSFRNAQESCSVADVVQLDEAAEFLDKGDHKALAKESGKAEIFATAHKQYSAALRERRNEVRRNRGQHGRNGNASSSSSGPSPKLKIPHISQIDHSEAKRLAPPGSYVWRSRADGSWNGRLPPFRESARRWQRYSERGALLLVLRILWEQYCDYNNLELSTVPVEGLFDGEAAEGDGSSASGVGIGVRGAGSAGAEPHSTSGATNAEPEARPGRSAAPRAKPNPAASSAAKAKAKVGPKAKSAPQGRRKRPGL